MAGVRWFLFLFLLGIMPVLGQEEIYIDEDLLLQPLGDSLFIHKSWHSLEPYGRFSSNGLLIVSNGKGLMVDTPMDEAKTQRLYQYLQDSLDIQVTKMVPTHFHADCLGGMPFLHTRGVNSTAHERTQQILREKKQPLAEFSFEGQKSFVLENTEVQLYYPGPGHSTDNIVVWVPSKKVLFGGCLVRSMEAKGMGNTSDANLQEWGHSLEQLLRTFPEAETVIPGHGAPGALDLVRHTLQLWRDLK